MYNGQNVAEFGGLPVVIMIGDDYQLMTVQNDGAIND